MAGTEPEHRFGVEPDYSVGLEEELLLVDDSDRSLKADAERLLNQVRPDAGALASEIFATEVELVTPVCQSVQEAVGALASLLRDVQRAGTEVIGAGLHPSSPGDGRLIGQARYSEIRHSMQGLLRTPPASLHVHVGMPDPETAIRVANGMRRHLPLLHALSANSPFWYGRDSGLASARAAVLRSYPRYGVPPRFRDWGHFLAETHEITRAASVRDYTYIWWDVRLHPRLGTVEVRAPDSQFSLERTTALAALIHALARMEADSPSANHRSTAVIEESCYQATRYGLAALLPDQDGIGHPAKLLADQVLAQALPYAQNLGCEEEMKGVQEILRDGNGADVQRSVYGYGGMSGLLDWLVRQRAVMPRLIRP
jgi:carboxylate-amine ligase